LITIKRFWNFKNKNNDDKENKDRELHLEGPIGNETWWGDEITPKEFKTELNSGKGGITVFINSPGGDVFAASEIYTALKEYSKNSGKVTVKISALAASAASIVAMAGDEVLMSPTAYLMIHNPWTITAGNSKEMRLSARQLDEIKEGVINAYQLKSGLPRDKLSELMNSETYMNARKAVELGFADEVLYEREDKKEVLYERNDEKDKEDEKENKPREVSVAFIQKMATNRGLAKIRGKPLKKEANENEKKIKNENEKKKEKMKEANEEEKEEMKEEKEASKTNLNFGKYHEILKKLKT
jgi:ATP-dependent Clp protease protease subunit